MPGDADDDTADDDDDGDELATRIRMRMKP